MRFLTLSITLLSAFLISGCSKQKDPGTVENGTAKSFYKITFIANGGSNVEPESIKMGELATIPNNPNYTPLEFDGWFKDEKLNQPYNFKSPVESNLTLYAKWRPAYKTVTTIAGITAGFATGRGPTTGGTDGVGTNASFWYPEHIAIDEAGNLYVSSAESRTIRKISPQGVVTTIAGKLGTSGNYQDGYLPAARLMQPGGMVVDKNGTVYFLDEFKLRKVDPDGLVTTIAGDGKQATTDGKGVQAQFYSSLGGIVFDKAKNLFMCDQIADVIRKITPDGVVTTVAGGDGTIKDSGYIDGIGRAARFFLPRGMAIDANDNIYIADFANNCIRKMTPDGVVITFAGSKTAGFADGIGTAARFNAPSGITIDKYGNLYTVESDNFEYTSRIRMITPDGAVRTILNNSTESIGFTYRDGAIDKAFFNYTLDIAVDKDLNLYVIDYRNTLIRKISK